MNKQAWQFMSIVVVSLPLICIGLILGFVPDMQVVAWFFAGAVGGIFSLVGTLVMMQWIFNQVGSDKDVPNDGAGRE